MRKATLILFLLLIGGVAFPYTTHADVYQVLNSNTSSGSNSLFQPIGTNLSGYPEYLYFYTGTGFGTSQSVGITFNECSTSSYTNCTVMYNAVPAWNGVFSSSTPASTSKYSNYIDFQATTSIAFNPSKYYIINFTAGSGNYSIWGSNATTSSSVFTTHAAGSITGYPFSLTEGTNAVKSTYFNLIINAAPNPYSGSPYITWNSPTNGTTTLTTNVNFNFSYNTPSSFSVTEYLMHIYDITTPTATTTSNINGAISGTTGNINRTITLQANHLYQSCVTLTQGAIIGSINWEQPCVTFSVITNYTTNYDQFFNVNGETATSSADFYGIIPLISRLVNKIPFGYVVQIKNIWDSQITTGGNFPLIDLDMASLNIGSGTPMGNFLPDMKVSTTTIRTYMPDAVYNGLFLLQAVSFWGALAFYLWRRGQGLFHMT